MANPNVYNLVGTGYDRMTVVELRAWLKKHNLKVSGKRSELIDRLVGNKIKPPEDPTDPYLSLQTFEDFGYNAGACKVYRKGYQNCNLHFYRHFFERHVSKFLYTHVYQHLNIPSRVKRRFNRTFGDEGLVYRIKFGGYSGRPIRRVERKAEPWDTIPMLGKLRDMIQTVTKSVFTYCVVQYYPCGKVGIKPHRDKEMTPGSVIAGLSLGVRRTLRMSYNEIDIDISLGTGSLYIFYPPTNDFWTHSILTDDKETSRISLTFRTLI
jgi:hypothetical protein